MAYNLHDTLAGELGDYSIRKMEMTSSLAVAEGPHKIGDFKGLGHFEAKLVIEL